MAGNWKMNMNHLEAIALVQKLAFTLTGKDFDSVEVAVLPPFTALRSVQTLIDGDKLRISYGAQDLSRYDSGPCAGSTTPRLTSWSTPRYRPRCGPRSRRSCAWGSRSRYASRGGTSNTSWGSSTGR